MIKMKNKSDGSTADYYELPEGASELQDLISFRDMNGQMAEIFRAVYRYGIASHSGRMRDAKKIQFYIDAEIKRLEKYGAVDREEVSIPIPGWRPPEFGADSNHTIASSNPLDPENLLEE